MRIAAGGAADVIFMQACPLRLRKTLTIMGCFDKIFCIFVHRSEGM